MKRGFFVRSVAATVVLVAASMIFGSCSRQASHLVFIEDPLWVALGGNALAQRFDQVGEQTGRQFEIRRALSSDAPVRELEELLYKHNYRGVVLGPLLSIEVGRIAPIFPEVEFVALRLIDRMLDPEGVSESQSRSSSIGQFPNLTEINFARASGFQYAGKVLSLIETSGVIGVISIQGRDESSIIGFQRGYAAGGGHASFDHRRLISTNDRGEVRRILHDFSSAGIGTVLLQTGPLTVFGLEVMRGERMRGIVSNWGYVGLEKGRPLEDVVLCSVDDDLMSGLLAFYRALDRGDVSAEVVGPTVLRWGGAVPMPRGANAYVDRRPGP